mmetsp:Transcript_2217/g.6422  ORF Transcript_2217/g.6422 Transcript_2217/m.6422 type:complete len:311 (-) Transcript_2217:875-1807(-)
MLPDRGAHHNLPVARGALRGRHLLQRRPGDDELAAVARAHVHACGRARAQAQVQAEGGVEAALVVVQPRELLQGARGRAAHELAQRLAARGRPHGQDRVAGELDHVPVVLVHDVDELLEKVVEDAVEQLRALLAALLALEPFRELRESAHVREENGNLDLRVVGARGPGHRAVGIVVEALDHARNHLDGHEGEAVEERVVQLLLPLLELPRVLPVGRARSGARGERGQVGVRAEGRHRRGGRHLRRGTRVGPRVQERLPQDVGALALAEPARARPVAPGTRLAGPVHNRVQSGAAAGPRRRAGGATAAHR